MASDSATDAAIGRRQPFRPDVQALRALAVASVVAYHLWGSEVPGGFVGVDIFFVISGFLITQQLVLEVAHTGGISLRKFWARRIRRILPAALLVLGACLVLMLTVLPQVEWSKNAENIKAAAAYGENWLLGINSTAYLTGGHNPTLVQHYWSLSVEEQFYLVWPCLLLVIALLARRAGRARRRGPVIATLAAVTVSSYVVSIVWTSTQPTLAFFATPARAWEFALGGLVAALPSTRGRLRDRARPLVSWLGLAMMIVSIVCLNGTAAFPGAIAAVPVVGAALFIVAGVDDGTRSSKGGTSLRPVQWLGNSSYSIYLWHWPLIIAAPWVLHRSLTTLAKVAIVIATLLLAELTRRFVEDPIRSGGWWRARLWPAYSLAAAGVAAVVSGSSVIGIDLQAQATAAAANAAHQTQTLVSHHRHRSCFGAAAILPRNHCARPFARPSNLDLSFAASDGSSDPCLQQYDATSPDLCSFGPRKDPAETVAIVGNSHAWRLLPAVRLYGSQHRWRVILAARIDCVGGLITRSGGSPTWPSGSCLSWSAALQRDLLDMPKLSAVIFQSYRFARNALAGPGATPSEVANVKHQILATWSQFDRDGVRVIVTGDVPGMRPVSDPQCLAASSANYDPCSMPRAKVARPNLVGRLARQHPRLATYIPLDKYFCDANRCHALIGGVVVYFDSHHMTTTFARSLAPYLGPHIARALPSQTRRIL